MRIAPVKPWFRQIMTAARSANRRRLERRNAHKGLTYADWVHLHDTLNSDVLQELRLRMAQLPRRPLISVLMPVFDPNVDWLRQAIESVERQIYPNWELCVADDRSTDAAVRRVLEDAVARDRRIRVTWRAENGHISRASNSALEMASGEYVALLDHDDVLPAHALLLNAEVIARCPRTRLLYSDEDVLRFDGQRQSPNFKPDWNPELFRSQNLVCHLGVYATTLLRQIGGFRPGYEGAQDYDVALRCVEHLDDDQIVHIPHVLYHWRQHPGSSAAGDEVKPYIAEAGRCALQDHLERVGVHAEVTACPGGGYRVVPALPNPAPSVAVVVSAVGDAKAMRRCVDGLLGGDMGLSSEVLICVGSEASMIAHEWLSPLMASGAVRLVRGQGPGTAASLREAAAQATADFLCLIDGDVEITNPGCMREMVALATIPGTGVVGAKLLRADGSLAHGGFILGGDLVAAPAHPTLGAGQHGYRSRAVLNQNLSAISSACMVVRRSLFMELDGFDARFASDLKAVDFCLRLRDQGLRAVWAAHAQAIQLRDAVTTHWPSAELVTLRQRWHHHLQNDPAYNPNLDLEAAEFQLDPRPRVDLKKAWFTRLPLPNGADPASRAVRSEGTTTAMTGYGT